MLAMGAGAETVTVTYNDVIYEINGTKARVAAHQPTDLQYMVRIASSVPYNNEYYTVTELADSCFYECTEITRVYMPVYATRVGKNAFEGCSKLIRVAFSSQCLLESIGDDCFAYCSSLKSIEIPDGVVALGDRAFFMCTSLSSYTLPSKLEYLPERCFGDCPSLTELSIPENIVELEKACFSFCTGLKTVNIPSWVTSIGIGCFTGCNLDTITVDADNAYYDSRDNCNAIIETASGTLVNGCHNTVIPAGVTALGISSFEWCDSLKSIVIPEGVTIVDETAFLRSKNLKSIKLPSTLTEIGTYCFYECESLESIEIPAGVTKLESMTFYGCTSLKTITFPATMASLLYGNFRECTSLESIVLPNPVPPTIPKMGAFTGITEENIKLYVPAEAVDTYKATAQWKNFNIQPISDAVEGDVNGDGIVDISDVNEVINIVLGKSAQVSAADVDGSGTVDISDVNAIINIMLGK